jgi:hypothetical protein
MLTDFFIKLKKQAKTELSVMKASIFFHLFKVKRRIPLDLDGELLIFRFTRDDIENNRPITEQQCHVKATMLPDGTVKAYKLCFNYKKSVISLV